jgi:hypothetical protein
MTLNGRMILPLLLLGFWLYMAWSAFSSGNRILALIYLAVGIVITAWRLKAASA